MSKSLCPHNISDVSCAKISPDVFYLFVYSLFALECERASLAVGTPFAVRVTVAHTLANEAEGCCLCRIREYQELRR